MKTNIRLQINDNQYIKVKSLLIKWILIAISIGNIVNFRSITVYKISLGLQVLIFIYLLLSKGIRINWNIFLLLMALFIFANLCFFGVVKNPHSVREKLFFIARLCGHFSAIFILFNLIYGNTPDTITRALAPILYISSSINILINIIQVINDSLLPLYLRVPHKFFLDRSFGLFMDPNYNGYFISVCIFLLFFLNKRSIMPRIIFIVLLIGNFIVMFLTLSFGTFFGFILAGVAVLFISGKKTARIVLILAIIGVLLPGFFAVRYVRSYQFTGKEYKENLMKKIMYYAQVKFSSGSAGSRMEQYNVALHAFSKHPLFGIGTVGFLNADNYKKFGGETLRSEEGQLGWIIHSNIFAVLGENGLAGFLPYMSIIILGFIYSWKLYKKNNCYISIFGMQIASFVISNTINTLYFNFFWLSQFIPYLFIASELSWPETGILGIYPIAENKVSLFSSHTDEIGNTQG